MTAYFFKFLYSHSHRLSGSYSPHNNTTCSEVQLQSSYLFLSDHSDQPQSHSFRPRYSPYRARRLMNSFSALSTHAPRRVLTCRWIAWKITYPYPISSILKPSMFFYRHLNVSILASNHRKHIAHIGDQLCVCYITLCFSISGVQKAHMLDATDDPLDFCSICPIL